MTRAKMAAMVAGAILAGAMPAWAQDATAPGARMTEMQAQRHADHERGDRHGWRDGPDHAGRLDGMFAAMDADGDGRITRAEAQAHGRFGLDPAAAPVDAAAFEAAVTAQMARMAVARAQALFAELDADKDGLLDAAELQTRDMGRRARMFDRLDADGDGVVTRAEADEARAARRRDRD